MRTALIWLTLLAACSPAPVAEPPAGPVPGEGPLIYQEVEENLRHDTLVVQVTFDLGDGTFLMVASNVTETFEGLRLHHYRPRPDSSAEILATSSPAYDSWTMLPTCFRDPQDSTSLLILANFGEKQSWGQKLLRLNAQGFQDLGFLDVALPEREMEDDTLRLKRRNIAPTTRLERNGDMLSFRFATDSVFLYDDHAGQLDLMLPASSIRYTLHATDGLSIWVNGLQRPVRKAS